MKSLADLPSEVLGQLLSFSSTSYLVLALWKCGDSALNRKLLQGVTTLDLKRKDPVELIDEERVLAQPLPSLLFQLPNLRHVALDTGEYKMEVSAAALWAKLQKLPLAQLETLELNCSEAKAVFRQSSSDLTSTDGQIDYNNDDEYLFEEGDEPDDPLFDLNEVLPNLRSLTLSKYKTQDSRDGYMIMPIQTLFESDMPHLPQSLTKLKMAHFVATEKVGALFAKLPRTLEVLDTALHVRSAGHRMFAASSDVLAGAIPRMWSDPPPHLHTVLEFVNHSDEPCMSYFPKTLTKINFSHFAKWTLENLKSLPQGLRSLEMFDVDADTFTDGHWMQHLPPSLTSLDFYCIDKESLDLWINLPRTLTSFSSEDKAPYLDYELLEKLISEADRTGSSFWPPHLTRMSLPAVMMPMTAFKLLPRTLTALTASCLLRTSPFPANDLPRSLLFFTLHPHTVGTNMLIFEPEMPNLTSLTLYLKNVGITLDEKSKGALPPSCKTSIL